jgi:hypothetical protein
MDEETASRFGYLTGLISTDLRITGSRSGIEIPKMGYGLGVDLLTCLFSLGNPTNVQVFLAL